MSVLTLRRWKAPRITAIECCCIPSAFSQCNTDTGYKQGGYTSRWQGLTFVNTARRIRWTEPYKEIFNDLDGSLTGSAGGWATPYYGWNEWDTVCVHSSATHDSGLVCDGSVVVRLLQVDGANPRTLDFVVR